jgi:hypothetical protein
MAPPASLANTAMERFVYPVSRDAGRLRAVAQISY